MAGSGRLLDAGTYRWGTPREATAAGGLVLTILGPRALSVGYARTDACLAPPSSSLSGGSR